MKSLLISTCIIILLTSCSGDRSSFCDKYESDKNRTIELALDSLNSLGGAIAKNYILVGKLENEVRTVEKRLISNIKHDISVNEGRSCQAFLRVFDRLDSKKYFKPSSKGLVTSFVPVITFDRAGRVEGLRAVVKYSGGDIDTVNDQTIEDFTQFVDYALLEKFKMERDLKTSTQNRSVATRIKEQEALEQKQEEERRKLEEEENKKTLQALLKNSISAETLCQEFEENEVRANKSYLDKEVIVNGLVHSVDVQFGEIHINLRGDDFIGTVSCVTSDSHGASKLQKGQKVVLKGICRGIDPIIKNIVTLSGSKILAN